MFQANVHSFNELISCIIGNFDKFNSKLNIFIKKSTGLLVVADGKIITSIKYLDSIFNRVKRIELIPLCNFSAAATSTIVFTSIKVKAWAAFVINTLIFLAISLGISFLIGYLLSPKGSNGATAVKTASYIFSNKDNIAARNTVIPISYGRLRLGSRVLSGYNLNFDISSNFDIFQNLNLSASMGSFSSAKI